MHDSCQGQHLDKSLETNSKRSQAELVSWKELKKQNWTKKQCHLLTLMPPIHCAMHMSTIVSVLSIMNQVNLHFYKWIKQYCTTNTFRLTESRTELSLIIAFILCWLKFKYKIVQDSHMVNRQEVFTFELMVYLDNSQYFFTSLWHTSLVCFSPPSVLSSKSRHLLGHQL